MRTTEVTTDMNVNVTREAYIAPQVEVIEMETEGVIAGSPGADDNGDPSPSNAPSRAPFWEID